MYIEIVLFSEENIEMVIVQSLCSLDSLVLFNQIFVFFLKLLHLFLASHQYPSL